MADMECLATSDIRQVIWGFTEVKTWRFHITGPVISIVLTYVSSSAKLGDLHSVSRCQDILFLLLPSLATNIDSGLLFSFPFPFLFPGSAILSSSRSNNPWSSCAPKSKSSFGVSNLKSISLRCDGGELWVGDEDVNLSSSYRDFGIRSVVSE